MTYEKFKTLLDEAKNKNYFSMREYKTSQEYYDGKQLSEEIIEILKQRGQPPQTENIYAMLTDKIIGYKNNEEVDIIVSARSQEKNNLAILLSNILQTIFLHKDWNIEKNKLFLSLSFGIAIARVWVVNDKEKNKKIAIDYINPNNFFIDPYSIKNDCSDAEYFIHEQIITKNKAEKIFKNITNEMIIKNHFGREFIKIYELFILENNCWNRYLFSNQKLILKEIKCFKHNKHPYIIQKLKIDSTNNFYGFLRNIKDLVDGVNFAENRLLSMLGSTKILFEVDAVDDIETFITSVNLDNTATAVKSGALSQNKIIFNNQAQEIIQISQKLAEKKQAIRTIIGFNDEMLGLANNRMSANAIGLRSEAGIVSLTHFLNTSNIFQQNIAYKILQFISYYFHKEQIFKVADKNNVLHYFKINENDGNEIKNKIDPNEVYDLEFITKPKSISNNNARFATWGEVIKTIASFNPNLAYDLLPLAFKDADNSVYRDMSEILEKNKALQEQQQNQQMPQQNIQEENLKLQNDFISAKINTEKAKAVNYLGQGKFHFTKQNNQGERNDLK